MKKKTVSSGRSLTLSLKEARELFLLLSLAITGFARPAPVALKKREIYAAIASKLGFEWQPK